MRDVVIIGGGPAGLTLGCYLARAGVPCTVLERGLHPRPHVGESLLPSTVRIFREIGFHPVMEAAEFPRSEGVVYHPRSGDAIEIAYSEYKDFGGVTFPAKIARTQGEHPVLDLTVSSVTANPGGDFSVPDSGGVDIALHVSRPSAASAGAGSDTGEGPARLLNV